MVESWVNVQGSGRAFVPDFDQRLYGSVISTIYSEVFKEPRWTAIYNVTEEASTLVEMSNK